MTIHVPRPVAILAYALLGAGAVAFLVRMAPELVRYAKIEGM